MAFEPVFDSLGINVRRGKVTDRIKAECRTDIPADGIKRIINISSFAAILHTEAAEGKIEYGGRIAFFISYEAAGGQIKKCECGAEFTGAAASEAITPGCFSFASVKTEREEADLSGVKLTVSAAAEVTLELYECVKLPALTGGEELILKTEDLAYERGSGLKEGGYIVEERFTAEIRVEEVLAQRAHAAVTSVQCGVGVIIAEGEVYFSAILLQSGDKKDIIRENRTIPFRAEIECEAAMPVFTAQARVSVKSLKTDIRVDEEKGISEVTAQAALVLLGEAFSEESAAVAADAFSTSENLNLVRESAVCVKELPPLSSEVRVSGRAEIEEIPVGASLGAVCRENAELAEVTYRDGTFRASGAITFAMIFTDAEGGVFSKKAEIPFETEFSQNLPDGAEYEVCVTAERGRAKLLSLTEAEAEFDLVFTVFPRVSREITVIKEISSEGEKPVSDYAISVYIPVKGEELWDTAKRLNVAPEKLAETNRDLIFPLSGEERIVVYREKAKTN